ncbi:hypothetical protein NHX12_025835 [Muraenolepis orangiensis]|uniref:Uncharacterized protein n=1 Tax=Muraenolepis orangiensis TaxID=630683 RepID=A0A9Q0EGF1_9TELE|nr:hypothetical protein NHX12_025835 [Muraenolepis orangiensis]
MDAFTTSPSGITSTFTGDNAVERRSAEVPAMWRPWDATCVQREAQKVVLAENKVFRLPLPRRGDAAA